MMKRLLTGAAALLASSAALCATMIPSSMINWVSVPTWPSVSAGLVFAGPTAATGAPTFRALVATDLPVVPVSKGGTNATAAGGAALDNITGFASTGFLTRTGAGTYAFQSLTNGITLGNLAQAAANTVLANATGSMANVAAFAMPSCSTSSSALTWTSGTGFTCNTAINASTLGGATFASPGLIGSTTAGSGRFTTLQATAAITPAYPVGIVGNTSGSNVSAGAVGEPNTSSSAPASLTSGTTMNVTSVSLSAGDWDVTGTYTVNPAGTTVVTSMYAGLSTISGALGPAGTMTVLQFTAPAGAQQILTLPTVQVNASASTTVYCVTNTTFNTSTATGQCRVFARRR
ncbi:hypothetical protein DF147_09355 [Burkholderia cenocepacia]|nr:hypothetical protein DF147_09355 [Burkholderia cenocepacia]RQV90697.1 hypothetical protein DF019_06220 [Burkholderia cenocepacia]